MPLWVYALLGLLAAISFSDERLGFACCLFVGMMQDLLRKLVPGEPVYLTALVGGYLGITVLGIVLRGRFNIQKILAQIPLVSRPLSLFILFVIFQCFRAFLNTNSFAIPVIGLIAYIGPLVSLYLGYYLTNSESDFSKYVTIYIVLCVALVPGVYLSYMGFDWRSLEAVGVGLHAYNPFGGILELHGGFWRGSELAGGYCALGACFVVILGIHGRRYRSSALTPVLIFLFLVVAVFITGRRKFLVEVVIFLVSYGFLLLAFRHSASRLYWMIIHTVIVGMVIFVWFTPQRFKENLDAYYVRTLDLEDETPRRFEMMQTGGIYWAYQRNGFWGAGAGVGSQGAQHFGGGARIVGAAAEGGVGKVLAELGVPGILILSWFGYSLIYQAYLYARRFVLYSPSKVRLVAGIGGIIVGNMTVFTIAHQIFGDVFYLLMMGWLIGALLALVSPAQNLEAARAYAAQQQRRRQPYGFRRTRSV